MNEIVETYRGTKIWDLWAQLAVKYQVELGGKGVVKENDSIHDQYTVW